MNHTGTKRLRGKVDLRRLSWKIYTQELKHYGGIFDIRGKEARLAELEPLMSDPELWSNPDKAKNITQEATRTRRVVNEYHQLSGDIEGLTELLEIASDEEAEELKSEQDGIEERVQQLYLETLFSGDHDDNPAIVTIKPGAGGTESSDWAGILMRMYRRFAERNDFEVELVDVEYNHDAPNGIEYAQMVITGERAFGLMRVEGGVHRLVRVSPFDSQGRRHTSFASVEIMPEIHDDVPIEIDPSDVRVDVFRSSGPGGQSVNTTDSAVRLVYKGGTPDEIMVSCQDGKSQIKNRERAFQILRSRLFEREEQKRLEEQLKARGVQKANEWGSQIRSYVLDKRYIKDHRNGAMRHDPDAVLDGDLMDLIYGGLQWQADQAGGDPR